MGGGGVTLPRAVSTVKTIESVTLQPIQGAEHSSGCRIGQGVSHFSVSMRGGGGHTPPHCEDCEDNRVCHSPADPRGGILRWVQGAEHSSVSIGGGGSHTATL